MTISKKTVLSSPTRGSLRKVIFMAVTVLLCYAREDERMARQLKQHLSSLERNRYISVWDYGNIDPGTEWNEELKKHLNEAEIILLLVSASFLASDYCYEIEMQQAIERHERQEARVIPVILRDCYWNTPPLDKLQPLPDGARPVVQWKGQDKGYTNIVEALARIAKQGNSRSLPEPVAERKMLMANLDQLVEAVKAQMQPPPRASHTASTLQELSIYIPVEVTLADLVVGWKILSQSPKNQEEPATSNRRITCGELASIASQFTTGSGNLAQAIKTWDTWQRVFKHRDGPRYEAMAKTFARELGELQEAACLQQ
jgi:hypothetical protein